MSEEETVTYELEGEIALVGLTTGKRNCFNPTVMKQLRDAIERAGEEAKCGIIFGHGDNFCAGLDLRWAAENWKNGRWERLPFPFNRNTHYVAMARGNIPFIAALHGATLGGGLENGGRRAYPCRRRNYIFWPARGHARHFHRRRRLGSRSAACWALPACRT